MKAVKVAALVAVLLVAGYFAFTAFVQDTKPVSPDVAGASDAHAPLPAAQRVPMPQVAKPVETLPASTVEGVFPPPKKSH